MAAMFVWGKSFKHHVFDNNIVVKEDIRATMVVSRLCSPYTKGKVISRGIASPLRTRS